MTIMFTDEEKQYIVKKQFNWHVDKSCPQKIKKTLVPKLKMLNKDTYTYEGVADGRFNNETR